MRIKTPLCLNSDAYTISAAPTVSEDCHKSSTYNFVNRISPKEAFTGVAKDSRMVLYGLTDFIANYMTEPVTHKDVDESVEFMSTAHSFGGPLYFNEELWRRVVHEHKGYLPIEITALPEGSCFFPNEPVIEVHAKDGFGELAAHIEALMVGMVSIGTARATLTRHLLDRMRYFVKNAHPSWKDEQVMGVAQWMIHDFGMRASSCGEESELLGKAHLLSFHGTDTFNAAYQAWKQGAKRPTGTSIMALAHRIVQGHATERFAYESLYEASHGAIGSYVADCYNFERAVSTHLVDLAKRGGTTVVARPDSGDYINCVRFIVKAALAAGLFEPDEQNRPKATTLRFIEGDSMTFGKMQDILYELKDMGVDPVGWGIFGVGGYLRNTPTRDSLSSAYKLCNANGRHVVKLSHTPAKLSIPGWCDIKRPAVVGEPTVYLTGSQYERHGGSDAKIIYYGEMHNKKHFTHYRRGVEDFSEVQNRAINDFDKYKGWPADFGLNRTTLSQEIKDIQDEFYRRHQTS